MHPRPPGYAGLRRSSRTATDIYRRKNGWRGNTPPAPPLGRSQAIVRGARCGGPILCLFWTRRDKCSRDLTPTSWPPSRRPGAAKRRLLPSIRTATHTMAISTERELHASSILIRLSCDEATEETRTVPPSTGCVPSTAGLPVFLSESVRQVARAPPHSAAQQAASQISRVANRKPARVGAAVG